LYVAKLSHELQIQLYAQMMILIMKRKAQSTSRNEIEELKQIKQQRLDEAQKYHLPTDQIMKQVLQRTGEGLSLLQPANKQSFGALEQQLELIVQQKLSNEGNT
jgi:hypothetical protein